MTMSGGYHRPFEQRRGDLNRMEGFLVKPTRVTGFELTIGAGEVSIDVKFPVWFVEKPSMSFGGELEEGEFIQDRKFPTVSVVVVRWEKAQAERGGGWFVGANLAVVTTGKKDHRMWVHWQAEGKAIANPSSPGAGLDQPI